DRFLLAGRCPVALANASHHRCNVAILAIERQAALRIVPTERSKPALDCRNRMRLAITARCSRRASGDIQSDNLGVGWKWLKTLAPTPAGEMRPVGRVGAPRIRRARRLYIAPRLLRQLVHLRRKCAGLFPILR